MRNAVRLVLALGAAWAALGCAKPENPATSSKAPDVSASPPKPAPMTLSKEVDDKGVSEETLGLPYYPASKPMVSDVTKGGDSGGSTISSTRTTTDAVDAVLAFYLKLVPDARIEPLSGQEGVQSQVLAGARDGKSFLIMATKMKDSNETIVNVTSMAQPPESAPE